MITKGLLDWLAEPSREHGLRVAGDGGAWRHRSYADLAALTERTADRLAGAGVAEHSVVCLVLPTGEDFVAALFATWTLGATVCPLVPPALFQQETEYVEHLAGILERADPSLVVTSAEFAGIVAKAMADSGSPEAPAVLADLPPVSRTTPARPPSGTALLQFTSGSSGRPRGVEVPAGSLEANIGMIHDWLAPGPGDAVATWLPLYHDMGLIGCLIFPVVHQIDIWLMRPDQFIRDPKRWLACLGDGRATMTASPPFGYAYAHSRVRPADLEGLDFSRWRVAVVGAEPIGPETLDGFARLTEGRGFRRTAFVPAYGLAEATLVVSAVRLPDPPGVVRPDWTAVRFGEPVPVLGRGGLGQEGLPGALVSCGPPAARVGVEIVDDDGAILPEGTLGEIAVRGPAVAAGYRGGDPVGSTSFHDGVLRTGDAGFMLSGELFVAGRIADSLKVRGRSVYVEDLDAKVSAVTGLSRGRCAVVSAADERRPGVVLLAEAPPGDWVERAVDALRTELGPEPLIRVITGRRGGLILRGSSGKPRRRLIWQRFQDGRLNGDVVAVDPVPPAGGGQA